MAAQEKRKEFCAILGVGEQASKEEIKRAYKQLALQCHPDKNQLNPEATKEFQKISEAYTGLCDEGMDSADEDDINDFDGGVSLLELLQLFFSMSRRKPFFMRSPSSWFGGHYSEDSDDVNDSDDACGPVRQNIRNHAGQQAWNDNNHFVPGNARPQSSSKDAGKTGKAKKRKNRRGGGGGGANSSQNNNQSTLRRGTAAGASTSTTTAGGNTGASTNSGAAGNRASTLDQDGSATEATSENQLPGRAGANDEGANQGGANDAKEGTIREPPTDNNNFGENLERRGSNGSLRGTAPPVSQLGQPAEKKPNKKKLQAEQRIREKEYAEIHRAVLEKNRREEEKRKQKAERERAKLDTEFTPPPKLNATARDENKIVVNDCLPEVDPSAERQEERHGTSTEKNDAKDPETSDTASLDSDARLVKRNEGGLSVESSETIDSLGMEVASDSGQPSDDIKAPAASFDEECFDANHPEIGCNGDNTVVPNQGERQKFTRVFYGHSSKNQGKNNRFDRNFDNNADGGNAVGGRFPSQRGGYRGRTDNPNYRPHASNSGFVDRSFYRDYHYNLERDGPPNGDDHSGCASEEVSAGFKDGMGRVSRGQYGRGRGNRMRYQNTRFRNASDVVPIDPSKSADRDEPGQDLDRSNGVVDLDVKPSGNGGASLDSSQTSLPNSEIESQRGADESNAHEGLLPPCNGHRGGGGGGGYAPDNYETSKKGYWPRSNRNFRGQRGNFRGGFDGGGGGGRFDADQNRTAGSYRSKPVQEECWDPEEDSQSRNDTSHVDQVDRSAAEMPAVAERGGRGQHRGRRPDRGGFQRGGRGGRGFNSSNSHEDWNPAGSGTGIHVDEVDSAKEMPVHETTSNKPYRGTRPDRGQFQRDGGGGRGRGNRGGFRDRMGEAQSRGGNGVDWEPEKRRFDRGSAASNYDYKEYNGATMQFHRRRQTPGEAAQAPFAAANTSAQNQSLAESAPASDGKDWIRRSSEGGHPGVDSGPRNVWKDRQEFYEGALPRSKEEEDDMLRAALQLSELEIEERRLAEQVKSSSLNLSFTSSSVAGCPSETGWTADVLDIVTVDPPHPPRQKPADNAAVTDDAHARLQSRDHQADGDGRKIGEASDVVERLVEPSDDVERLVAPSARLKSWADEMEETNDPDGNGDAYPGGLDADSMRSPRRRGRMSPNSWALMNFGAPSDEAKNLPSDHSESVGRNTVVHPTAPAISPLSAMQRNKAVLDGVLRLNDTSGTSEHFAAREPLQRQPSMLDDIDDGVEVKERPRNTAPPDCIQGAAVDDHGFHVTSFPQIARHLPEAGNHTASEFSAENERGETVVNLPQSPGLPCPAFPPGPMPPMPWMQPGCPTYFFAVPGYPPWYPMPPYQHYWPCMPSGAPAAMPGGVMPMVSQSLSLAHSSNASDQPPMVSQVHLPMPLPNSLPLQQGHPSAAVPGLPPSMPTMLHPIPFGYPHHPGHMAPHPGAAMHVPFAPYPMLPSAETVDPTARLQDTGLPTNYTDEIKRYA